MQTEMHPKHCTLAQLWPPVGEPAVSQLIQLDSSQQVLLPGVVPLRCRTLPFTLQNFLGFLPWPHTEQLQRCRPGAGQHVFLGGATQECLVHGERATPTLQLARQRAASTYPSPTCRNPSAFGSSRRMRWDYQDEKGEKAVRVGTVTPTVLLQILRHFLQFSWLYWPCLKALDCCEPSCCPGLPACAPSAGPAPALPAPGALF